MKTPQAESANSSSHEAKLPQRRFRWRWNAKLLIGTAISSVAIFALALVSYLYHSDATASTFLKLAETAESEKEFGEQAKWLQRYSLLAPDDMDVIYEMAIATDQAAALASPEERAQRVNASRKSLSGSIARIGDRDAAKVLDLRKRLIHRLLQLSGSWNREAEQQIIALDASSDDPESLSFMARTLVGQLNDGSYSHRKADTLAKSDNYWSWISNQQVGFVLGRALKQNPNDVNLAVNYLIASKSYPDQFKSDTEVASLSASQQQELNHQAVATLQADSSSRAKLSLYRHYLELDDPTQASDVLQHAADSALVRLQSPPGSEPNKDTSTDSHSDDSTIGSQEMGPQEIDSAQGYQDPEFWDYLLVYESARNSEAIDPDQSIKRYRFLMSLDIRSISPQRRADVYLAAGNLLVAKDEKDAALETWQEGLGQVGDESILLLQAISQTLVSDGEFQEAKETISRLSDAIESSALRLSQSTNFEMTRSERTAFGRRLGTARWHLDVLNGYSASGEGESLLAIGFFRSALRSDADVASSMRVSSSIQLANLYGQQGSWDQAAAVLDQATALEPKNSQLGRLAMEAWSRSGNQLKAIQQWVSIDENSSTEMQIASIETRLQYQMSLLPQQQRLNEIRFEINRLRKSLQQQSREESDSVSHAMALRYLEALQMTIPPRSDGSGNPLSAVAQAKKIDQLSKQHPEDFRLQAFAADKLAGAGERVLAMSALDRLASHPETTPVSLALVKARVFSSLGDHVEAAKSLMDQALAKQTSMIDSQAATLLQTAASYAARGGDSELAYQALVQIEEKDQALSSLFAIAGLAKRLPADSSSLSLNGKNVSAEQLSKHWAEQLRRREGENGTYWRFHQALNRLTKLHLKGKSIEKDDPRLSEARKLVDQILARRPRWGDAISLGGWISVIEGEPEKAVIELRRGMAAGDRRLQTRRLLWEQLISLGRNDEAEREIQRASLGSQYQSDRYSASRIDLAIRQGDFFKSMEVAAESAKAHPEDVLAQLVIASTGTTALRNIRDESQRKRLLAQTRQAIAKAGELAVEDDPRVLAAGLRLALALDDAALAQASIKDIRNSSINELAKTRLLGQAHVALKQYDLALPLLRSADQLKPTSESQLSLAELYRLLERPGDEIQSLRIAQKRDGANEKLRNLLAQKLVAQSADGKPLDWQEIGDLLSGSDGAVAINRLMYAILQGSEGLRELKLDPSSTAAEKRLRESKSSLRNLIRQKSRSGDDASRYLVMLLQEQGKSDLEIGDSEQKRLESEVRSLYESLYNRAEPRSADIFRYASYLLDQRDQADDAKIENLLRKLNSIAGGTLQCLEVGIRFANRQGEQNRTPEIVADWAKLALSSQVSSDPSTDRDIVVFAAAGSALLKLGFTEDSVEWFERAYRERPKTLNAYIVALVKAQQSEKALDICVRHFTKYRDATSAKLLFELLLSLKDSKKQADRIRTHSELIKDAVRRFDGDVALLEGVGTLRMAQGEFENATDIFQRVLKKDPLRIRALNNLAMALSEIPGRASEGLAPIDVALELGNQNSELLDTKGVVLMASGRVSEAEDTFAKAFLDSREPRHQFHLIMAQWTQGKEREALRNWKRLDLGKLDPSGLTSIERKKLREMKNKFGS